MGQPQTVDLLLTALLADGHILLEGVPGVAKTLMAKLLSRTISVDFSRIQFTPDMMPSDVIGTAVFNPKVSDFEFRKGPIFSNIVLIDEINRSPAPPDRVGRHQHRTPPILHSLGDGPAARRGR